MSRNAQLKRDFQDILHESRISYGYENSTSVNEELSGVVALMKVLTKPTGEWCCGTADGVDQTKR
jgi:hypothetical protein